MASVAKLPLPTTYPIGTVNWLNEHTARAQSDPHAEVALLTPGLANVLLQKNPENRHLTSAKIRHFANDMRRGAWPLNGETIIISKEGLLNDGQHRCAALIEANVTIPATFFFGADRDTRKTVDLGAARTAAHFLAMDGLANATHRAAVARLVMAFEVSDGKGLGSANTFTALQCYERARDDSRIAKAAAYADAKSKHYKQCASPSVVGFCLYILSHVDEDDATAFINQVVFGEGLKRKDPAYTVRERLLSLSKRDEQAEIILRGWVAHRQRRSLTIVKVFGSLPAIL